MNKEPSELNELIAKNFGDESTSESDTVKTPDWKKDFQKGFMKHVADKIPWTLGLVVFIVLGIPSLFFFGYLLFLFLGHWICPEFYREILGRCNHLMIKTIPPVATYFAGVGTPMLQATLMKNKPSEP
jgi:hypothetical protein